MNKPISQDDCNCFALRQAARYVTQIYERHLGQVGLTAAQFTIIAKLARKPDLTMMDLADLMVMERTTLVRALKPLQREWAGGQRSLGARRPDVSAEPVGSWPADIRAGCAAWRDAQEEFEPSSAVPAQKRCAPSCSA